MSFIFNQQQSPRGIKIASDHVPTNSFEKPFAAGMDKIETDPAIAWIERNENEKLIVTWVQSYVPDLSRIRVHEHSARGA
jgi:hypothetical protein